MPRDPNMVRVIEQTLLSLGDPDAHTHALELGRQLRRAGRLPRLAIVDPLRIDPEVGETTTNGGYEAW